MCRLYQNTWSAGSGSSSELVIVVGCVWLWLDAARSPDDFDRGNGGGSDMGDCALLELTEDRTFGDVKYGEEVDRGGRLLGGLLADVLSSLTLE